MTYAGGRAILDADSHLMELPGFLDPYIERDMIDRLKGRSMAKLAPVLDRATGDAEARKVDDGARAQAETYEIQERAKARRSGGDG